MSHVPRAAILPDDPPLFAADEPAMPKASTTPAPAGIARRAARFNDWMRRYSWAVAMTVAIVITVGGLVILESGRMRIAAEYEVALDAKGATTQLTELAAEIATLTADERAYVLAPEASRAAYAEHFGQATARIRRIIASLDGYYHRKADDTALASF